MSAQWKLPAVWKDKNKGKITVDQHGDRQGGQNVVRHAISMGPIDGFVLDDAAFENLDSFGTAYVLSKAIQKIVRMMTWCCAADRPCRLGRRVRLAQYWLK